MDEIQKADSHKTSAMRIVVLIEIVVLGTVAGCVSDIVYGVEYETFVMPSLDEPQFPYGQQAMFMAVVSSALGGAIALSVALCCRRQWASGILLSLTASSVTCGYTWMLWADSHAFFGTDSSDNIIYVPVFFASLVILCLTILIVSIIALSSRRWFP